MSDPLRKVRPGDDLRIPAAAYNAFVDAARAHEAAVGPEGDRGRSGNIVPVVNDTGSDLPIYSVVGIGGPAFAPGDDENAFLRGVALRGVVPTSAHARKFAILAEPTPAGRVGPGLVFGVVQARVDVSDGSHGCAVAAAGDTRALASAASGPAQILWREGGTGEQWVIVRRSASCGGPVPCDPNCPMPRVPGCDCGTLPLLLSYAETTPALGLEPMGAVRLRGYPGRVLQVDRGFATPLMYLYPFWISGCVSSPTVAGQPEGRYLRAVAFGRAMSGFELDQVLTGAWEGEDPPGLCVAVQLIVNVTGSPESADIDTCRYHASTLDEDAVEFEMYPGVLFHSFILTGGGTAFGVVTVAGPTSEIGCDPPDFTARFAGPDTQNLVPLDLGAGIFGEGTLVPTDPETILCCPGCWTWIRVWDRCPESCPGGFFRVRDVESGVIYGPLPIRVKTHLVIGEGSNCSWTLMAARVYLPGTPAEGGGYTIEPRTFEVLEGTTGLEVLHTVEVEDCEPVQVVTGPEAESFALTVCLEGCPSGPLPGVTLRVRITSADQSEVYHSTSATTGSGGCFTVYLPVPDVGAEVGWRIDLYVLAGSPGGYESDTEIYAQQYGGGMDKPDKPGICGELLIEATLGPNEHHVCTCGGLAPKCLSWDGNGAEVELHYDDDAGRWEGEESIGGAIVNDQIICGDEGPAGQDGTAIVPVTLGIGPVGEDCVAVATRTVPVCFCGGEYTTGPPCYAPGCSDGPLGMGTPRLADTVEGGTTVGTKAVRILAPWGPTGAFPGITFGGAFPWTRPDGTADPVPCWAPAEGYALAAVGDCPGGGLMAPAMAPPPAPEPPLPSPLRMAGELARTAGRVVYRAARGGTLAASADEQARRWAICRGCDHFRASDRRCGKLDGCGCYLARKIPVAASACPIGKWGPEGAAQPPPAGGP